jgi:hypothetical protein
VNFTLRTVSPFTMSYLSHLQPRGSPDFTTVLVYLSAYFIIELGIKKIFKFLNPKRYTQLYNDRKDIQYFAFIMGILITAITTPFCATAFISSNPAELTHISMAGQVCIASRSVLWVSELNRLDHSVAYLAHHFASLGYLIYHLQVRLPLQIIYGFYASLATELFSDARCLLDIHGIKPATSLLAYRIHLTNTILLVVLRIPPIIYGVTFLPSWVMLGPVFWINAACLLFYTRFILNLITTGARRIKMFEFVAISPAHIRVCQTFSASIYSIFFSIASFFAAVITSTVYLNYSRAVGISNENTHLTTQFLFTGFSGLVGARIPSILMSGDTQALLTAKFFDKTPLWLQGSITGMAFSVGVSPLVNRERFMLALCLSLPCGEAIGRVGCHFAGCCGWDEGSTRQNSLQIRSSTLNGVLGVTILSSLSTGVLTLPQAAGLSISCNSLVRLFLRPNRFAVLQLVGSLAYLGHYWNSRATWKRSHSHGSITELTRPNWGDLQTLSATSAIVLGAAAIAAGVFVQICGGVKVSPERRKGEVTGK